MTVVVAVQDRARSRAAIRAAAQEAAFRQAKLLAVTAYSAARGSGHRLIRGCFTPDDGGSGVGTPPGPQARPGGQAPAAPPGRLP